MEAMLTYIPFARKPKVRGTVMVVSGREVAYTIKDRYFPDFNVYKSANAWWMDSTKLNDLIEAFKAGHTIKDSLVYAKVSQRQYQYFNELHPDFCHVKEACEGYQNFGFMNTINANKDDPNMARWFMEKTHPKFNPKKVGEGQTLQPTVNIAIGANVDAGTIASAVREIAREVFAPARRSGGTDTQQPVAVVAGEE